MSKDRQMLVNTDALLFDLDGTLWDSTEGAAAAWQTMIEKEVPGLRPVLTTEEFRTYMGRQIDDIGRRAFPMLSEAEAVALARTCLDYEYAQLKEFGGTLYPRVAETLMVLAKRYKLCIISNCECGYIETFLELEGLRPYITDTACCGETGLSKGENNQLIIARNGFQHACYIGDTHMDGESARAAGIPFVFCRYGFGQTKEYDFVIDRFVDLLDLFPI